MGKEEYCINSNGEFVYYEHSTQKQYNQINVLLFCIDTVLSSFWIDWNPSELIRIRTKKCVYIWKTNWFCAVQMYKSLHMRITSVLIVNVKLECKLKTAIPYSQIDFLRSYIWNWWGHDFSWYVMIDRTFLYNC
jgi:hypothetical protein